MAKAEHKTFATPDETRTFARGRVEIVHVAGSDIGRLTLDPGWRWSSHVKDIAGTDLCEAPHFQYRAAGRLPTRQQVNEPLTVFPSRSVPLKVPLLWLAATVPLLVVA